MNISPQWTNGGARPSRGVLRAGGYGALLSVPMLMAAGVALALFFGGAGAVFGTVNDVLTAVTLLLIALAVEAVRRLAADVAGWVSPLSLLTIAGLLLAALGFGLLVAGVISLQASFLTFGLGMLPFLGWVIGLAVLALRHDVFGRGIGWWVAAFLAVTLISILALPFISLELLSLTLAPVMFVSLAGWLVLLGRDLLSQARGPGGAPTGAD